MPSPRDGSNARVVPEPMGDPGGEQALWQLDAVPSQLLLELRADPGPAELSLDLAANDAPLLEAEDVLKDDDVALHALDLGDVRHLPRAVEEPLLVYDQV